MAASVAPVTAAPAATAVAPATYPATPYPVTPYPVTPVMPDSYYGGFWIRLAAHLIDHVVFGAVFVPAFFIFLFPAIIATYHDGYEGEPPVRLIVSGVVFLLVALSARMLYEIISTSSSWQGTIGKKLLRLKVTDDFGNPISLGRSAGRFFAKLLSGMASYIGFIMIAFMDRKRGLHDVIAKTQVLRY